MHRRASALVYVIIVVFSITSVVIVTAKLASSSDSTYSQSYADAQFKAMVDGAVAEAKADAYKGTLATGSRTSTFTSRNASVTVSKPATLSRSFQLDVSASINGREYRATKIIGNRATPHPTFYGLWTTSNYTDSTLATALNGSAYFLGDCALSGAWTVSDDLLVKGASTLNVGSAVTGHFLTGVRTQAMPTAVAANYTSVGTSVGNSLTDVTFGAESGGFYPVFAKGAGNMTLGGGTMTGKGTLYVAGNLTVNGNYNYANADSRAVIIVGGRMTVAAGVTQLAGTFYVLGRIDMTGTTLTIPRGNLCTGNVLSRTPTALNVTQDRTFLDSADECRKHRLPGY